MTDYYEEYIQRILFSSLYLMLPISPLLFFLPHGGERYDDVIQGIVEWHFAFPRAPVCSLHLNQEVGQAGHNEDYHQRFQASAHELGAQNEYLPATPTPKNGEENRFRQETEAPAVWCLEIGRGFSRREERYCADHKAQL